MNKILNRLSKCYSNPNNDSNRRRWIKSRLSSFTCISVICLFTLITVDALSQDSVSSSKEYTIFKDLQFLNDDTILTLDLYLPLQISETVPCIMVIQGGGFHTQNGQRIKFFAEYIARHQYAAALISYRGRPGHTYKTTVEDVKASVRFIRENSTKFRIDPDRIGATGRSAGATLAAMLAVNDKERNHLFMKHKTSSAVQAAVPYAGVFNFTSRFIDSSQIALQPGIKQKIITNSEWIGVPFSNKSKHWRLASPAFHLDKDDPPILFLHCKDDKTVPWLQSREMHEKMQSLGIHSEILIFEKGGHGFSFDQEAALKPMICFFKQHFEHYP